MSELHANSHKNKPCRYGGCGSKRGERIGIAQCKPDCFVCSDCDCCHDCHPLMNI